MFDSLRRWSKTREGAYAIDLYWYSYILGLITMLALVKLGLPV